MDHEKKQKAVDIIRVTLRRAGHRDGCPGAGQGSALFHDCSCGTSYASAAMAALCIEYGLVWRSLPDDAPLLRCILDKATPVLVGRDGLALCPQCRATVPFILIRAALSPGSYSLQVKTGAMLGFTRLEFSSIPGWVVLHEPGGQVVELQLSQVAMVADESSAPAPEIVGR